MHGSILSALRSYVVSSHGADAWTATLKATGLEGHLYLPAKEYPDSEAIALVDAVAKLTKSSTTMVLQGFGEFLAPALLKMYGTLILPSWKTLDLLENAETTMHRVVRMRNPGAYPPSLHSQRIQKDEVVITYASERKMCALAVGIILGIAGHYREQVEINESKCMHKGDAACVISVRTV